MRVRYFGTSAGAGAALVAAAVVGEATGAVVSRGGPPDLAGAVVTLVKSPTRLTVGRYNEVVIRLNREAYAQLKLALGIHEAVDR